ncbi:MAG: hypothetical protein HQ477_13740 [Chloroflexi bacterium]|nr:hypothetical protein [Chloroflexota bacterium]
MSIRTRVILVVAGALALTTIMAACSSGPTTVEIVQTSQAQNKEDNVQATRQAVIDAGGDPDAALSVENGSGSAAELANNKRAAEATAQAEQGIFAEGSGSSERVQGAAFEVEVPDGPALTGVIDVNIPAKGIDGVQFEPAIIKIAVGSTVRWGHDRRSASSSTSDPGQDEEWDSGDLHKGPFDKVLPSFEHTFTKIGCFTYTSRFSGDPAVGAVCVVAE